MPDEKSTKDVVLAIYPEAHVHYDEDAECCILTDKTEGASQLGYFEKTEDEAWESALADIEDREAENAGYEHYDEDEDEEDEEDDD